MTKKPPSDDFQNFQYWQTLGQQLPVDGVASTFETESDCRDRLAAVRWPIGVTCLRCDTKNVGYLELRKVYHCRDCRYQFTVLTGTVLHSSKLSPQCWFDAAEEYIRWRAANERYDYGIHALADFLGVPYPTAQRVRKILKQDLAPDGSGLLAKCICTEATSDPFETLSENL
ncbi:hypothetical protein DL239_08940 [Sedimentitalea sp. CY04]|uniref:Transposase zinc-ribbon domain-containing protein n=2 Tax=Parasedimentitalea denitrificans TaxID=2211118 RepID=A0ABX0W6N9_9RHOB|nr:transposase [Sedimentitalea sp. CY04]NIZ61101.1 hypothetical protein [Sedimentitalea sp. CY04]